MNCDHVFNILTRGPFPAGEATDTDVEIHLAGCHDCRQLAEALRPAVALFHEAIPPEDGEALPGYRGSLPMRNTASRSRFRHGGKLRGEQFSQYRIALRIAAAVALGVALGSLLRAVSVSTKSPDVPLITTAPSDKATERVSNPSEIQLRQLLATLGLVDVCLKDDYGSGADADTKQLMCCTQCHSAASDLRPAVSPLSTLKLSACVSCHAD